VTQVREPQYGLNGIDSRIRAQPKDDKRLRKWLFSDMEGVLELQKNNQTVKEDEICFVKEEDISSISSTEKDGHYMSMEKREKTDFILEQMRLNMLRKDFIRTHIISRKINTNYFAKEDVPVCFVQIDEYYLHDGTGLEVALLRIDDSTCAT
jgi:hypothetical protein